MRDVHPGPLQVATARCASSHRVGVQIGGPLHRVYPLSRMRYFATGDLRHETRAIDLQKIRNWPRARIS